MTDKLFFISGFVTDIKLKLRPSHHLQRVKWDVISTAVQGVASSNHTLVVLVFLYCTRLCVESFGTIIAVLFKTFKKQT